MNSKSLIHSYVLLLTLLFSLFSCTSPTPPVPRNTHLYIYRFNPPAFIEFSRDFQAISEIPFSIPPSCGLFNVFGAPVGPFLVIELSCPNGQTVLLLDTDTSSVTQPVQDSDSHFLAWAPDGKSVYLKTDSLGNTQVALIHTDGKQESLSISPFTYDLAPSPDGQEFAFTLSAGMGQGSELHLTKGNGRNAQYVYADPYHYVSFARFSPDGNQIAFIKIPDTPTPFTVGELWVMDKDGSNARKLAGADAGHGYAANWSPDGKRIAFVVRENPENQRADRSSEALVSNVYVVDVNSGALTQITDLETGHIETPHWSPEGNTLAFNIVINDRMQVQIADLITGEIRPLVEESTCCPTWLRK